MKLISTKEEVIEVADALSRESVIGVDTEFIRETTFFPKIALIQVSTEKQVWLLDPLALDENAMGPVLDVLRDPNILKLMHAAFADQECLYWSYNVIAEPILDTAVAAALTGYGDNVGLGKLLKEVCGVHLAKGRARVKWLQRPLSRELLQYAEADVATLVKLGRRLMEKLERHGRLDWAKDESIVPISAFDVTPEETAERMARNGQIDATTVAILAELVRWRDGRAKHANLPRQWVASNEVLLSLAKVKPKSIDELRSFRGLNAKEVDRSGDAILDAVEDGLRVPAGEFTPPPRQAAPNEHEDHVIDLIRAYVTYLAAKLDVAPRYLIQTGRSVALLRNHDREPEDWVRMGIMTEPACRLVGAEMKALLQGKRALVLKGGRVEILEND